MKVRYVHIPKAAGTSILKYLKDKDIIEDPIIENPRLGSHQVYKENSKDLISLAIVRNPYSRVVSAYHYLKQGGMHELDRQEGLKWCHHNTFEEFCLDPMGLEDASKKQLHFVPQTYFMPDGVDVIVKLERIKEFSDKLSSILSIDEFNPPHVNKSTHTTWQEYYMNSDVVDIVKRVYLLDFIKLNYNREI